MTIEQTLQERNETHGNFRSHAAICQALKDTMRMQPNWDELSDSQKEALEMIQHKIARILNGSPNHADHWHDIIGYAALVEKELEK